MHTHFFSLLRAHNSLLPASAYALISLSCTQIPLLNYLGYEFSFLVALLASIISGILTIRLVKLKSARSATPVDEISPEPAALFKYALAVNLSLLVIPLVVMVTNALFVRNCSMIEGTAFFILLPVVSVWFASGSGFFCAVVFRFPKTLFLLFLTATIVYALGSGYFTPAIYSYNFFYGYFPGLTYDEALGLSWTLLLFRSVTILFGALFVWAGVVVAGVAVASHRTRALLQLLVQPRHRVISGAAGLIFILSYIYRGQLGFESPAGFIQKRLGGMAATKHFTIYYSKDSYSDNEIRWISAEHEFRMQQVLDALSVTCDGKIESYIYPSAELKKRMIGTKTTNIAKPWSGQLHLTSETLHRALKHELVHVLSASFGLPIIKASISTGLMEGLAMAIEWDWGNRLIHHYAAAMRKFGAAPDISQLMFLTGFATHSSPVSYVLAGSFCRFLIDTYGIQKMRQLYRTVDYTALYGRPLKALINDWQQFLDTIPVDESDRDAIDVLFHRPAIFDKVCARVVAERNSEARKSFSDRDFGTASALYAESYSEGKGYDAFAGYLSSELRRGNYSVLTSALDTTIQRDERPGQFLPLFLLIGDAYWAQGNMETASALYNRVKYADISTEYTESAVIRSYAIRDSESGPALLNYFLFGAEDSLAITRLDTLIQKNPESWIPRYLSGRKCLQLKRFALALTHMQSLNPGLSDTYLEEIRLQTMGVALFRLRRFQEAKTYFQRSLNSLASPMAINEDTTWIHRCDWMENYLR